MTTFDQLLAEGYKRWYRFGGRSLNILYRRLKNKYAPIYMTRMAWQRVTRGHDASQLWSLNYTVAALTVAGVRYMRETQHGYPGEFSPEFGGEGWPKWDGILARIEEGFQTWLDEDGWFHDKPEAEAKFKDGMALFGEWFGALWD